MKRFVLQILMLLFSLNAIGVTGVHNGLPVNVSEDWLLVNVTYNGTEITTMNSSEYLFYVYAESEGEDASLGTADINGNSTESSYLAQFGDKLANDDATFMAPDPTMLLSIRIADFSNKRIGCDAEFLSFRIKVFKTDGSGEFGELIIAPGTLDWTAEYFVDIKGAVPELKISVPPLLVLCSGATTGNTTTATISGATGVPTITLSNVSGGFQASYVDIVGDVITVKPSCPAGVYKVKATVNDDITTAETEFTITVNQTPKINNLTASPNPVCFGQNSTLTANMTTAGTSYIWESRTATANPFAKIAGSGSAITQNLTNLQSTADYRVIATNGACKDTLQTPVKITVNSAPTFKALIGGTAICLGETVSLKAERTTGDNTGITFAWNSGTSLTGPWTAIGGQTGETLTQTPTTVGNQFYQVVGTLAGCSGTQQATVTVNPKPELTVTKQPTAVCQAQVDLRTAITTATDPLTYFSDAACTAPVSTPNKVNAGTYYVKATNATTTCSSIASLTATVNPLPAKPTITAPGTEFCSGSTLVLTGQSTTPGVTYVWKGATSLGTANTQAVSVAGSYTVEVTDNTISKCKNISDAYVVTMNPKPTVKIEPVANTTNPSAGVRGCLGDAIALQATAANGTGAYTYTWSANATVDAGDNAKATATLAANNTYTVSVTDAKGCISAIASKSVTGEKIAAGLTASPASIVNGTPSTLTASFILAETGGNYKFLAINPAQAAPIKDGTANTCSVSPTETTEYRVVAKNTIGCADSATTTVTVQEKELQVIEPKAPVLCAGETTVTGTPQITATVKDGAKPYQSVQWTGLPSWLNVDASNQVTMTITGYNTKVVAGTYSLKLTVVDKNGVTKSVTLSWKINAAPSILINGTASGDLAVCKNEALTLTATGGVVNGYTWTAPTAINGTTSNSVVVTTTSADPGTAYTVTGKDAQGCTATAIRNVIIRELPTISIDAVNSKTTICSGTQAKLTAQGAATYTWNDGMSTVSGTTITPTLTANKTYTITGKDANGCESASITQLVTVNPLPVVTFDPIASSTCAGSEIELAAALTVGTAPYKNYVWTGGAKAVQNDSVKAKATLAAGTNTYSLSVTDANGCMGTKSVSVNGIQYTVTLSQNTPNPVTEGTQVTLTAAVTPSGSFTYTFKKKSDGTILASTAQICKVTVNETTTYQVDVEENGNKCTATADITITTKPTALRIESLSAVEVCQVTEDTPLTGKKLAVVKGGTKPYTFDLTGAPAGVSIEQKAGTDTIQITGITAALTATVQIPIKVTDATSASETRNISLTVNPLPNMKINNGTGVLNGCVGQPLTLTATPSSGVSYNWTAPAGLANVASATQTVDVSAATAATTYTVEGTTAKGCKATATRDVVVNALPTVTLITDITEPSGEVCAGTAVMLIEGGADTYAWNNGLTGNTPTVHPTTTTTYTVTGTNTATGCSNTASVTVTVNPLPTVTISQNPTGAICAETPVTLTAGGGTSYQWTGGPATADYAVTPLTNTEYEVTVTDAKGCVSTKKHTVNVQPKPILNLKSVAPACGSQVDLATVVDKTASTAGLSYKYYTSADVELTGVAITVQTTGVYKVEGFTAAGCSTGKKEITITIHPNPIVSLTADKANYCSGDTIRLTATDPGNVTFAWSPLPGIVAADGKTAKDAPKTFASVGEDFKYSVKVTDKTTGCTGDADVTVHVNPLPTLSVGSWNPTTTPIPAGQNLTLTVAPSLGKAPYTYNWVKPTGVATTSTSATLPAEAPRAYFAVIATDDNGCISDTLKTDKEVLPQGGTLTVDIERTGGIVICDGGMNVLTAKPKNGRAEYHYVWKKDGVAVSGATSATLMATAAGKYTVEVTDDGTPTPQTASAEITLTLTSTSAPTLTLGADQTIKTGTSTVLFATTNAATPTYVWSPVDKLSSGVMTATPKTVTLGVDQVYSLYVIGGNLCNSLPKDVKVSVSNSAPVITATASRTEICKGNTSQLSVIGASASATYEWTPATDLTGANTATPIFTGKTKGANRFVVKVTDGGKEYGAEVSVNVLDSDAPKLAFAPDVVNCLGDLVTVTSIGSVNTYAWFVDGVKVASTGATHKLAVGKDQEVKVVALGINSCSSDSLSGTFTIHAIPEIRFAASTPASVTEGASLDVTAENVVVADEAGTSYQWTYPANSTNNPYHIDNASGNEITFTVTGTKDGCPSTPITTKVKVNSTGGELIVKADSKSEIVCNNGAAYLSATATGGTVTTGYKYEWFVKGASAPIAPTSTCMVTPTADAVYVIRVSDNSTPVRMAYDTVTVTWVNKPAPTADAGVDMSVLPNHSTVLFGLGKNSTAPYSYVWSPADKLSSSNTIANPTTTPLVMAQAYSLYVVDANGCKSKPDDVTVNVPADFFAIEAIASPSEICLGNTATLRVKVTEGTPVSPTYLWASKDPLADNKKETLKFTPTVAGTYDFYVTVTDGGRNTTAQVTVKVNGTQAPKLKLDGTIKCLGDVLTVSTTNGVTLAGNYQWFVNGAPKAGTGTSESQYKLTEVGVQNVKVIAEAADGCTSDTVTGVYTMRALPEIQFKTTFTTVEAGKPFMMEVEPKTGAATAATNYYWTSPVALDNNSIYAATAGVVGSKMTFKVYGTDAAGCKGPEIEREIEATSTAPKFNVSTDIERMEVCQGATVIVKATPENGTANYTYAWYEAGKEGASLGTTDICTVNPVANMNLVVKATDSSTPQNVAYDTVYLTVKAVAVPKVELAGTPRCVGDTIFVKHLSGATPTKYDRFVIFNGNMTTNTGINENYYKFAKSGNYGVKFVAHAGECASDTVSGNYIIGNMQIATVTPDHHVALKDSVVTFKVTAPTGNYDYEWSGVVYNASGVVVAGNPVDATTKNSAEMKSTPMSGDYTIFLKATAKDGLSCPAVDTVNAYLLPAAPKIDIDTATNRVTAKIVWGGVDKWATGSTIYRRKWDPYCMTSADAGKYAEVYDTKLSTSSWNVSSMDTLEFFYMTSYRNIPGVGKIQSPATSDTVGYKLDSLKVNSISSKTSNSVISWMFDMTSKGYNNTAGLMDLLESSNVVAIRKWSMASISFNDTSTTRNPMFPIFGDKYDGVFNLEVGRAYQMEASTVATQLMQYGKLPSRISMTMKNAPGGVHNNVGVLPYQKSVLSNTENIYIDLVKTRITAVRLWNFVDQEWSLSTTINPMYPIFGNEFDPVFDVRPSVPLQIEIVGSSFIWR